MKKIGTLFLIVIVLLTVSCDNKTKKEIKEETAEIGKNINDGLDEVGDEINEFGNDVKSAFDDITIPKFDDEKAEAHLKSYAAYVKSQMDKGAENIKNSEFVKETKEFAKKSEMYMGNLGEDAKASFKATLDKIDAKVEEIENDIEA